LGDRGLIPGDPQNGRSTRTSGDLQSIAVTSGACAPVIDISSHDGAFTAPWCFIGVKHMKKIVPSTLLALLAISVGCPQTPPADPISSIDGLEGGRIVGGIEVASLVANTVTTAEVETDAIAVNGDGRFSGTITASVVEADSVNVGGGVTTSSLSATTVSLAERPSMGGIPIGTDIVGTTSRADGPSTAATAEASCADSFDESHICGEAEFLEALPFFTSSVSVLEGASVRVSSPRSALRVLDSGVERDVIANDCANWTVIGDVEGGRSVADAGEELAVGVTVMPFVHGRLVVDQDDSGRVFLAPSIECAGSAIRFACCR
jgi:hypothetical protein